MGKKWLFWFDEIGMKNDDLAGKKCANLGELTRMQLPVPPGFAISVDAYEMFMNKTEAIQEIREYFDKHGRQNRTLDQWTEVSMTLRKIIETQQMPIEMAQTITSHYHELSRKCGVSDPAVSVRSAGRVSRPGQYETHLNVKGSDGLLRSILKVWSSSFNPRSLAFRAQNDMPIETDPIGIAILGMINARTSGIMLTAVPHTGDDSKIVIEANWGLGESVVSGAVTPDYFILDKNSLDILEMKIGEKSKCISCSEKGVIEEEVPFDKSSEFCLTNEELKEIAKYGKLIEEHFRGVPQDVEWAISSNGNNVFLLQTRPAVIAKKKSPTEKIIDLIIGRRLCDPI